MLTDPTQVFPIVSICNIDYLLFTILSIRQKTTDFFHFTHIDRIPFLQQQLRNIQWSGVVKSKERWWGRSKVKGRCRVASPDISKGCACHIQSSISHEVLMSLPTSTSEALQSGSPQPACNTAFLVQLSPGDNEQRMERRVVQVQDCLPSLFIILDIRQGSKG